MRKKCPFLRKRALFHHKGAASCHVHGGIPCYLALAHFTVHIVQVRLNFTLGLAREANHA